MRLAIRMFGLAVMASGLATASARADVFLISGQLGADTGVTTGLAGGSFDGSYSVTGLPATHGVFTTFDSFTLDIKNASGLTVDSLTSAKDESAGIYGDYGGSGIDLMMFSAGGGAPPVLQLAFTSPFNGTGQVIPTDVHANQDFSSFLYATAGSDVEQVLVTSGVSTPFSAVPEPSALALAGVAACSWSCYVWRRRRRAV